MFWKWKFHGPKSTVLHVRSGTLVQKSDTKTAHSNQETRLRQARHSLSRVIFLSLWNWKIGILIFLIWCLDAPVHVGIHLDLNLWFTSLSTPSNNSLTPCPCALWVGLSSWKRPLLSGRVTLYWLAVTISPKGDHQSVHQQHTIATRCVHTY